MKSKLLIRISAILILVHLIGHTIGHLSWKDETGPHFGVVKQMISHQAEFMGATKSMADYYNGYSLLMFGIFAMTIVLLWILSNNTLTNTKMANQILYLIGVTYVFFGIIEWMYFFPFASAISLLAGLLAFFSAVKLSDKLSRE